MFLNLYCVTGFSSGYTKLTTLFALCCLTGGRGSPHLVLLSFSPPELNVGRFQAELNKMSVFILRAAASGFTAKGGKRACGMGNLTLFSRETGFSLRLWSAICPLSQSFPARCTTVCAETIK